MIKGIHGLFAQRPSCFCFCICLFVSPRGGQGSVWESVDEGGDGSGVVGGAGKGHRGESKQSLEDYRYIKYIKIQVNIFHIYQARASEARANRAHEKNIHLCLTEIVQNQPKAHILLYQKITQGKTCLLLKSFSITFDRKSSSPPRKKNFFDRGVIFSSFPCHFTFHHDFKRYEVKSC